MNIEVISDGRRWNEFVVSSGSGHLLQGFEWGEFKARFGWGVERVALLNGGKIICGAQLFFRRTPIGPMAYVPRGPVVTNQDPETLRFLLDGIHDAARERKAIFLKIEPNDNSLSHWTSLGLEPSTERIQPRTTIHVDLTPDLDTISRHQKPKTRYGVRTAAKRGVTVREGGVENLPGFYDLLKITSKRDGFLIHSYDYYKASLETLGENARLFCAFFEDELLACIMVMAYAGEAIYMYAASSSSRRNLMPNYLLQWEAMKWAKSVGCTRYDLWGIPDEAWDEGHTDNPSDGSLRGGDQDDESEEKHPVGQRDGLWGVYHFKRGFGGITVRYAGALDCVYAGMRYWVWQKAVPLYAKLISRAAA